MMLERHGAKPVVAGDPGAGGVDAKATRAGGEASYAKRRGLAPLGEYRDGSGDGGEAGVKSGQKSEAERGRAADASRKEWLAQ